MPSKIRDRIVQQAVRGFAAAGYSGTSTKEISERADVTEGSLFRLCVSKEKLFEEALASALAAKSPSRMHLRIVAFAILEHHGLTEPNLRALKSLTRRAPFLAEFRRQLSPVK